ncbi:MAG: DNA adenine methylase [Spirochaetia bacterium]
MKGSLDSAAPLIWEDQDYLSRQVITYIGNKRNLLGFIGRGLDEIRNRLEKSSLKTFDVFSGSGIVARYLKSYSEKLIVNDMELYSEVINRCYLANRSEVPIADLRQMHAGLIGSLREENLRDGFIRDLYAPEDDRNIRAGERVFYTVRNARYLDTARQRIGELPEEYQHFFLAPLLSEASVHANTSGVFKGFYKDRHTGIGKFGGRNGDALYRITGNMALPFPVFSRHECPVEIHRRDAGELAEAMAGAEELDVAYLDPPYNQHPYGSNYFMLNLITEYRRPEAVSEVSGIPRDWNRSDYNSRARAKRAFTNLVKKLPAKFLLISFNSEGFIETGEMQKILKDAGKVEVLETKYNTFRGSRNLRNRHIHVKEYLYLLEKR